MFPGRFLEEIDSQVDMGRLEQVLELRRIRGVEERFRLHRAGKLSKDALSGDYEDLSAHEKLLAKYGNDA